MKQALLSKIFLLATLATLLFSACDKHEYEIKKEMLLEGTWTFKKVTYHKSGWFNVDNITSDYAGQSIEFRGDKTVSFTMPNGSVKKGSWELEYVESDDDEVGVLAMSVEGGTRTEMHIWSQVRVRRSRLYASEDFKDGCLKFKLAKK